MKRFFIVLAFVLSLNLPLHAQDHVDQDIALLRTDIKTDKATLITVNMKFTAEESAAFWPVYKKYEDELSAIGDTRLAIIKDYAQNFETMTNDKASELTEQWFQTEEQRLHLKEKYFGELQKVLPAKTAARFIQVENRLNLLLDLQLAGAIPLVRK